MPRTEPRGLGHSWWTDGFGRGIEFRRGAGGERKARKKAVLGKEDGLNKGGLWGLLSPRNGVWAPKTPYSVGRG